MPPKELPIVVIDSCCLIDFFLDNTTDERSARVQELLSKHERDYIAALPSIAYLETLGITQKGPNGKFGTQPEKRRDELTEAKHWLENQSFLNLDLDQWIVDQAVSLMAPHNLKGADAAILASALFHEATTVYTFDQVMLTVGRKIPGLAVEEPPHTDGLLAVADVT